MGLGGDCAIHRTLKLIARMADKQIAVRILKSLGTMTHISSCLTQAGMYSCIDSTVIFHLHWPNDISERNQGQSGWLICQLRVQPSAAGALAPGCRIGTKILVLLDLGKPDASAFRLIAGSVLDLRGRPRTLGPTLAGNVWATVSAN